MKRPSESPARSQAVAAVIIGLRGNAIATDVPILIRLVCSAISAAGRKPSLPARESRSHRIPQFQQRAQQREHRGGCGSRDRYRAS